MRGTRTALVVGLAVAALAVAGCGGSDEEASGTDTETATTLPETVPVGAVLKGSVRPGFEISQMTEDGQAVETLTAGTYPLDVDDKSSAHNFHITGSGVDESTAVAEVGSQTFEITLEAGAYKFQCDPHAGSMNGSVEVSG